jgi:hypothetical protein
MPRMNRRRTLIGIAALVFGASGTVISGSFSTSSQGSLGDNWIQVAGINQVVSRTSPQQISAEDSSDSEGNSDSSTSEGATTENSQSNDGDDVEQSDEEESEDGNQQDDAGSDDGDEPVTTRVQVVTDPSNPENAVNTGGSALWNGKIVDSEAIFETTDGFFGGITAENINSDAKFTIGELDGEYPGERVAFIIANVGSDENRSQSSLADISASLFADEELIQTDQLRFSYRIVDDTGTTVVRGENLFSTGSVRLAEGEIIEIVVVIDTRNGDDYDNLESIDTIQFTATGINT